MPSKIGALPGPPACRAPLGNLGHPHREAFRRILRGAPHDPPLVGFLRAGFLRGALLAALALVLSPSLEAHDMGAMQVMATFAKDGAYRIEVVVDAEHLPPGQSPFPSLAERMAQTGSPSVQDPTGRLAKFRSQLVEQAVIAFDGVPATPETAPESQEGSAGLAAGGSQSRAPSTGPSSKIAVHLRGMVPRGAKTFTWSHALPLGVYLLRVQNEGDPEPTGQWLDAGRTSRSFSLQHVMAPLSRWQVVRLYLALGYTHIVPKGLDHILFVLGLYLLSLKRRTILMQVTAFTLAHSITLGLTIYGIVSLSPRIVEPLIALSIVYVAVENLFVTDFKPWRLAIVFGFGLLHGMGFAGVLHELGLPRSEFLPALVSFNVGVEAGQLTVIAGAYLICGLWFGSRPWYRSRVTQPASAIIACVGAYWAFQRVFL